MEIISSLKTIALKYQQQNSIPPFKVKEKKCDVQAGKEFLKVKKVKLCKIKF